MAEPGKDYPELFGSRQPVVFAIAGHPPSNPYHERRPRPLLPAPKPAVAAQGNPSLPVGHPSDGWAWTTASVPAGMRNDDQRVLVLATIASG